MVFLRSEEHLARWLAGAGHDAGCSFPAATLNALARRWWWSRLDPGWRPRPTAESQAILDEVGLRGPFWTLA